jgi:ParB/RepB/Spo0J family partition protein
MSNKFGLNDLAAMIDGDDANKGQKNSQTLSRRSGSLPLQSRAMTGFAQQQRLLMDMPVTKEKKECVLMELNPFACNVSPLNKRVQSLLSIHDPAIVSLQASIEKIGQREPVLVQAITGNNNEVVYELIYGSRRRFVTEQIRKQNSDFTLKAWVINGRVSEPDIKVLLDSENEDRQAISAWEQSQYLFKLSQQHPNWSQRKLADYEGITQKTLSYYIKLAALPQDVVALMDSPLSISLQTGCQIVKQLEAIEHNQQKQLVKKLSNQAPFHSSADLIKIMRSVLDKESKQIVKRQKHQIKDKKGHLKAQIGAHRTIVGRYKIDLFDVSDEQISKVTEVLSAHLS